MSKKEEKISFEKQMLAVQRKQNQFNLVVAVTGATLSVVAILDFLCKYKIMVLKEGEPFGWIIGLILLFLVIIFFAFIFKNFRKIEN